MNKVRIVWSNAGGELDSTIAIDDGYEAIAKALIKMISGNIVAPGDTFVVEEPASA